MPSTPHWGINEIAESQSGKEGTHNLAISILDAVANVVPVVNETTTAPPGSPADGDCYIIGATHTGAWTSYAQHDIALYIDGTGWINLTPPPGAIAWNIATAVHRYFTGSAWANL